MIRAALGVERLPELTRDALARLARAVEYSSTHDGDASARASRFVGPHGEQRLAAVARVFRVEFAQRWELHDAADLLGAVPDDDGRVAGWLAAAQCPLLGSRAWKKQVVEAAENAALKLPPAGDEPDPELAFLWAVVHHARGEVDVAARLLELASEGGLPIARYALAQVLAESMQADSSDVYDLAMAATVGGVVQAAVMHIDRTMDGRFVVADMYMQAYLARRASTTFVTSERCDKLETNKQTLAEVGPGAALLLRAAMLQRDHEHADRACALYIHSQQHGFPLDPEAAAFVRTRTLTTLLLGTRAHAGACSAIHRATHSSMFEVQVTRIIDELLFASTLKIL